MIMLKPEPYLNVWPEVWRIARGIIISNEFHCGEYGCNVIYIYKLRVNSEHASVVQLLFPREPGEKDL